MVLGAQVGGRQATPFVFCILGLNVGISERCFWKTRAGTSRRCDGERWVGGE